MTSATLEKSCTSCGNPVRLERPPKSQMVWADAIGVICPDCTREEEREAELREIEEAGRRFTARVKASGLPARWQGTTWEDMATDEPGRAGAIRAARTWSTGQGKPGLLLVGNVGTGKTRLAGTALWHRLGWQNAMWVSVPVLIAKSLGGFDTDAKRQAVRVLTEGSRTLVLDDIDKVKAGEWVSSQLFAAIDSRVSAGAGLLVTANLMPDELAEKLGGDFGTAIVSRLLEHCEPKKLVGRDRRRETVRPRR